jgi:protein-S-isoprenylcysteine O-methyltransferase Ste14
MRVAKIARFAAGYIVGFTVFFVLIPLLILVAAVVFETLGARPFPPGALSIPWIYGPLFAAGLVFALWSNIALFVYGKGGPAEGFGRAISPPTTHLVTEGPYRVTRNPMAFGTWLCYAAFALLVDSAPALCLVAAFLPLIFLYLTRSEEKRLRGDFGEEFARYRERVSLFFPLPPRRKKEKGDGGITA